MGRVPEVTKATRWCADWNFLFNNAHELNFSEYGYDAENFTARLSQLAAVFLFHTRYSGHDDAHIEAITQAIGDGMDHFLNQPGGIS